MDTVGSGNAMTEIALALAMGFFSIMVLTMVSMGAGNGNTPEAVAAKLAAPKSEAEPAALVTPTGNDLVLIYHAGRLMDSELAPVALSDVPTDRRIILAVDPAISMEEAIRIRASLATADLVVSTLDKRWLQRLERNAQ